MIVNEQLGFLLLAFFAYQYISQQQAANEAIPPPPAPDAPRDSSRPSGKEAPADESRKKQKPDKTSEDDKQADSSPTKPVKTSSSSKKPHRPHGKADGDANGLKSVLPTRFRDLTPEQQERYKLLLEQKWRRTRTTAKHAEDQEGHADNDEKSARRGKNRGPAGSREQMVKERAAAQPREPKRYEDLTDEQKADYLGERSKRKTQEKSRTKLGQGSGLCGDGKAALSRPPSPTA